MARIFSPSAQESMEKVKPTIGLSDCLTGAQVRFNAGHKRNRYITETLSHYFDFKAFCPEVAIGLSTPRPAIRMVQQDDNIKVIAKESPDIDYFDALKNYANTIAPVVKDLTGYIFMQKSPSCGVLSAKVYGENGYMVESGAGAFAGELIKSNPNLPVIEAGMLGDSVLRENFLLQVFAYHDWKVNVEVNLSANSLLDFHRRHKLQLRAHDEVTMRRLGTMLSNIKQADLETTAEIYLSNFMAAMKKTVKRPQQANLLYRLQKHLKRLLSEEEKAEVMSLIQQYREGIIPLIVPMTLLKFFVQKYKADNTIAALNPYPAPLGLQNSI